MIPRPGAEYPHKLTFEELYETLPADGWLTKDEARLLYEVAGTCDGDFLEVGCYKGRSSVLIAKIIHPHTLYCVDPFDGFCTEDLHGDRTQVEFVRNMLDRGITNHLLFSQKIEQWVHRPVVMSYLDGDHTYEGTIAQLRVAVQCGATQILVHDVNDSGEGKQVKQACMDVLRRQWQERVGRLAWWCCT